MPRTSPQRLTLFLLASLAAGCTCGGRVTHAPGGLEVTPLTLDFGSLAPLATRALEVRVRNPGATPATLTLVVHDDRRGAFALERDLLEVPPGETRVVAVSYRAPSSVGVDTALLGLVAGVEETLVALRGGVELAAGTSAPVPDAGNGPFDAGVCVPTTCAALRRGCGPVDDGCGGTLSCGACGHGATCADEFGVCLCAGGASEGQCSDGQDDDCDGLVDCADPDCAGRASCAAPACATTVETRVTTGLLGSGGPDLVWSGTAFGLTWMEPDGAQGYRAGFAALDAMAAVTVAATPVSTSATVAHPPRLAFGGTEWALGFSGLASPTDQGIFVQRLGLGGAAVGAATRLGSGFPATVASQGGTASYGVLWGDALPAQNRAVVSRLTGATRSGPDVPLTSTAQGADYGDLAWTGAGWAAVWTDYRGAATASVSFARVDAAGALVGAPRTLSTGQAWAPRVVVAGSELGIAWSEIPPGDTEADIFFARLGLDGASHGPVTRVTRAPGASSSVALAWTGSAYALAWADGRFDAAKPSILLTTLDAQGQKLGGDRLVSCAGALAYHPAVAWNGQRLGVAFSDLRFGAAEVFLTLLAP